jgi:hypothetical protein
MSFVEFPSVICPRCGARVPGGAFCQACGTPLPQEPKRADAKNKLGIVLAAGAAVVLALTLVAFVMGRLPNQTGAEDDDRDEIAAAKITATATRTPIPTKTVRPTRTPTPQDTATPTPIPTPTVNPNTYYNPPTIARVLYKKSVVMAENPGDGRCKRFESDEPPAGLYAQIELECDFGSIYFDVYTSDQEAANFVLLSDDGSGWYLPEYPDFPATVTYSGDKCYFAVAVGNIVVTGTTDDDLLDDSGYRAYFADIELGAGILAHYGVMRLERLGGGLPVGPNAPTL